jgi:membrane protease YdiL (CAAX protease family)
MQKHTWPQATLVLLCLVFFATGSFHWFTGCSVAVFAIMLSGLYLRDADVFLVGLICAMMALLCRIETLNRLWPLPILTALVFVLVTGKILKFTRGTFDWIKSGDLGGRQAAIIAIVAAISAIALVSWYAAVKPDIADLAGMIPRVHPGVLIVTGLVFALTNAACEEFIWRGIIFSALERTFPAGAAVLCIQALSFGAAHVHGFPRGASGIALASIYGYIMGCVRQQAKGLLAPIAAHFFADAVIYSILVFVFLAQSA